MYIITFMYGRDRMEVSVAGRVAVFNMCSLLESTKIKFKVWGCGGYIKPGHFGFGHFEYWMGGKEIFE